jgi:hypothetical protein
MPILSRPQWAWDISQVKLSSIDSVPLIRRQYSDQARISVSPLKARHPRLYDGVDAPPDGIDVPKWRC